MKTVIALVPALLLVSSHPLAQLEAREALSGPYLGQEPPRETPAPFARDIISPKCDVHGGPVFTPDAREAYWGPLQNNDCTKKQADEILFMREVNGRWTPPAPVSFSSLLWDSDDPCLSPDGRRLYFTTHRPTGPLAFDFDEKIMYVERTGDGWSSPKGVGSGVNSMFRHWQVSVNSRYDLYFFAEKLVQRPGIYVSRYVGGQYVTPERLPDEINSSVSGFPYIAPDDSFLIFVRTLHGSGDDLFVSFKDPGGGWSEATRLPEPVNSPSHDLCPNVSSDGKVLFFLSQRAGRSLAYWVSARVIDELRVVASRTKSGK